VDAARLLTLCREQEIASPGLISLGVPGRPIRSLVAEDQTAEGVRDQTELRP
jgi:hypothetical protein